ncbi:MAG: hypothetical protein JWP62_601 [Blastococcus sp.]|nr:hypothetical protein [Blastococcus sp.]
MAAGQATARGTRYGSTRGPSHDGRHVVVNGSVLPAPVHGPLHSFAERMPPGIEHHGRRQGVPVTAAPIRVLVVEDHAVARAGLVDLLSATGEMVVVGEAVDGHAALELAAEFRPDVVLMDVSMPNMSGLEATHVLTQQRLGVHVLMFSADARCSVVRAARDAGAVGFLGRAAGAVTSSARSGLRTRDDPPGRPARKRDGPGRPPEGPRKALRPLLRTPCQPPPAGTRSTMRQSRTRVDGNVSVAHCADRSAKEPRAVVPGASTR